MDEGKLKRLMDILLHSALAILLYNVELSYTDGFPGSLRE